MSQAADGAAQAAFTYALVIEPFRENTPGRILALFVLTLLPYSLLSPFMGVFVDRWPRRGLLVWTNVIRGALLVSLPLWAGLLSGDDELLGCLLVVFALGRLFLTTKGALLPTLLHGRHLLHGNAVSAGGGMVAALIGGVAGVLATGWAAPSAAYVAAGLFYAVAAWLSGRLSQPFDHVQARVPRVLDAIGTVIRELADGIAQIWARPHARLPLLGIFIVRTVGMFVAVAAILVIKDIYEGGSGQLPASALALGAAGAGAFTAAVATSFSGGRFTRPQLIVGGFIISGLGIVALGGIIDIYALLGLTFVGGFGTFVTKVAVDAQVQQALPDEVRGRAFALYDLLYNCASIAAGVMMVAFQNVSFRPLLVGVGIGTLMISALMRARMKKVGLL